MILSNQCRPSRLVAQSRQVSSGQLAVTHEPPIFDKAGRNPPRISPSPKSAKCKSKWALNYGQNKSSDQPHSEGRFFKIFRPLELMHDGLTPKRGRLVCSAARWGQRRTGRGG